MAVMDGGMKPMTDTEKKIAELQREIERLKEERDMYKSSSEVFYERLKKEAEQREKLVEVLRWYADKTNYVQEVHHLRHGTLIGPAEAIYYDEGQRAREILKEIGVTVE